MSRLHSGLDSAADWTDARFQLPVTGMSAVCPNEKTCGAWAAPKTPVPLQSGYQTPCDALSVVRKVAAPDPPPPPDTVSVPPLPLRTNPVPKDDAPVAPVIPMTAPEKCCGRS